MGPYGDRRWVGRTCPLGFAPPHTRLGPARYRFALNAADDDESRDHATKQGFVGYLTKPILDPDNIHVTMERHLPADRL